MSTRRIGEAPLSAFEASQAGGAYLAELAAEREARGKPYGLSADQVEAADLLGMDLRDYAAHRHGVKNIDAELERRRRQAAVDAEIERQAVEREARESLGAA